MAARSDSALALPPRGTPARRIFIRRTALTALLPAVTVAFAVMSTQAPHLTALGGGWAGMDVLFGAGLLVCLVLGVLCALDGAAVRLIGWFTIAVVLLFNPITFALALAFFGLT